VRRDGAKLSRTPLPTWSRATWCCSSREHSPGRLRLSSRILSASRKRC
jgi:hypothetical protein